MMGEGSSATVHGRELSNLENRLYSEARVEDESLLHKVGKIAKDVLNLYYAPKEVEKASNGRIYRALGVHLFKRIVPTGGDYVNRLLPCKIPSFSLEFRLKYSSDTASGLESYSFTTCLYETAHLGMIAISMPALVRSVQEGNIGRTMAIVGFNIAINLYPIMLQRYVRARISNVLEHISEKTSVV